MFITVYVKPKAKLNQVKKLTDNTYQVSVTAPAEKGKANQAVVELLAKYLNLKKNQVHLVAGFKARQKVVEVLD